jgi:hypothetical protein
MMRCRNAFLAFARYGSARTRFVLEAADGIEAQRKGPERAERLFHAWIAHRRLVGNETNEAEIQGKLSSHYFL